jgi:hypothetical protein
MSKESLFTAYALIAASPLLLLSCLAPTASSPSPLVIQSSAVAAAFRGVIERLDLSTGVFVESQEVATNRFTVRFFELPKGHANAIRLNPAELQLMSSALIEVLPTSTNLNITLVPEKSTADEFKSRRLDAAGKAIKALDGLGAFVGMFSFRCDGRYDRWSFSLTRYPQTPGGYLSVVVGPEPDSVKVMRGR